MKFDFGGYATKNDLVCDDGKIIRKGAFSGQHGTKVPLIWQHRHDDPGAVLGHAILEDVGDGVYARCKFNNSPAAEAAKIALEHGDVDSLSIWANKLKLNGANVMHGVIRELSLVLSGQNSGAKIDLLNFGHDAFEDEDTEYEAIITTGETISHAADDDPPTLEEVYDTFTDEQKAVVVAILDAALEDAEKGDNTDTDTDKDKGANMAHGTTNNIFEKGKGGDDAPSNQVVLTHDAFQTIMTQAKALGSLKQAFIAHAATYGIEDVEFLFPDAKAPNGAPKLIAPRMEWVARVLAAVSSTPFANVKNRFADITADEARARGYVKGALKTEQIIALLKRETYPTTVYAKQKIDNDDLIDITDFEVLSWFKGIMRVMLDYEIARALLIGDGRDGASPDKISSDKIRPIWTDDEMYSVHKSIGASFAALTPSKIVDAGIAARIDYRGVGSPTFYTSPETVAKILQTRDADGRRIYKTVDDIAAEMRVSAIEEIDDFTGLVRGTKPLVGIIVNLGDYSVGTNAGGKIRDYEDFDIDYNKHKMLKETRLSGALTGYRSAIVLETDAA